MADITTIQKSVLVTGCSSGIGQRTAFHLACQGYVVLATVRKDSDAKILESHRLSNIKPIFPLDLTKNEDIENVTGIIVDKISRQEIPPLHGIVLNAGGGKIAPVELMNIDDLSAELQKRVIGSVYLLKQFIPILRQTKGRVLWISTPGLFPVPYVADIHAADFAVNYLARTLNIELKPDGIKNILIRCGGIATSASSKTEKNIVEQLKDNPQEKVNIYRKRLVKMEAELAVFAQKRTDPLEVAKIIEKALKAKNPKTRYSIGHMSKIADLLEKLPQSWVDYIMLRSAK